MRTGMGGVSSVTGGTSSSKLYTLDFVNASALASTCRLAVWAASFTVKLPSLRGSRLPWVSESTLACELEMSEVLIACWSSSVLHGAATSMAE